MIVSKIIGGIGNQMFQYAVAKSVAEKKNEILKLDVTAYDSYSLFEYRLDAFNIQESFASLNEIFSLRGADSFINKAFRKLSCGLLYPAYYKEKERTIFDSGVFSKQLIYLDGYWQNEKYFLDIRDKLLKDFTPKNRLSENAKRHLENIKSSESISIHVRRGDYSNHPEIGILDIEYYKKAVNYLTGKGKEPVFFVFSNDITWCEKNFSFIKNKVFVSDTKTEIDDLWLMKNCLHNIIANSSFSWWAAWLNEHENKTVISPLKWMAINPGNHKWVPDSWLQF